MASSEATMWSVLSIRPSSACAMARWTAAQRPSRPRPGLSRSRSRVGVCFFSWLEIRAVSVSAASNPHS
jgi:hypothetical protein